MALLPVPVQFALPDGWQPESPEEAGAPDAAFVALRSDTAGIMLSGAVWPRAVSLREVAANAAEELRETASGVHVLSGDEVGSSDAPGFVQELRFTIAENLFVRSEVYLAMGEFPGQDRRAVVRAVLTCAPEEFGAAVDDFRSFVGSLTVDRP